VRRILLYLAVTLILLTTVTTVAACGGGGASQNTSAPSGRVTLTGAGATFPNPFYSKLFTEYGKISNVDVNYQSIGSGGGIRAIKERTVDFGASDGIMSDKDLAEAPGRILHIPTTSGAVAVAYNLSGIQSGLKLTPDILADIYLNKITRWNDPRITAQNPGINLPARDIAVVHRSDGSGTTYIFTNYLSKVSPEWKDKVGNATSVSWPAGTGGQGNEGVAGQVKQINGAIGYVELAYATQNNMAFASIKNRSGSFVAPSIESTTAAAQGVELPADMKVMITDSANPTAYPIAGFTWVLAYQDQPDQVKGKALADVLWWSIHDGQKYAAPLFYAPLSPEAVARAEDLLRSMTYKGTTLLK